MIRSTGHRWFVWATVIFIGSACSLEKSLPEGEYLYTGAKLDFGEQKTHASTDMRKDAASVISPKPNKKILGVPLKLWFYRLFYNDKDKGVIAWARRTLGEEPVIFDETYPQQIEALLVNRMENNGYFKSSASHEIIRKKRKVKIIYALDYGRPYHVNHVDYRLGIDSIDVVLESLPPSRFIERGDVYRLADLQGEAGRIAQYLKEHGYYYFSRNDIKFQADTTVGEDRLIDIRLRLKDSTPDDHLKKMYVSKIEVIPEYTGRGQDTSSSRASYEGIQFYLTPGHDRFTRRSISQNILFRQGDEYNIKYHYNTLSRLVNLNSLSYVNIRYSRIENTDSLKMQVFLNPLTSQNIGGSVGISYKNNQYIGPDLELNYTHRNLFRGSEQLRGKVFTNLNFPTRSSEYGFYEKSGLELSLTIPDLKIPFYGNRNYRGLSLTRTIGTLKYRRERVRFPAKVLAPFIESEDELKAIEEAYPELEGISDLISGYTEVADELAADSSYSPFIGINGIDLTLSYQWQHKPEIRHEITPLALGLQIGTYENDEIEGYLAVAYLLDGVINEGLTPIESIEPLIQLQDMVYWNPGYIFLFDSREKAIRPNNYFYRGGLAFLGSSEFGERTYNIEAIENLNSYFVQITNDLRYFKVASESRNTFAARLVVDVAYPFNQALFLPFFSFFTVAGPNSVRAYNQQELGPGSSQIGEDESSLLLLAGRGNIHLESSIEYRAKITSILEYAAFVDVGNVWVLKSSDPKARFDLDSFHKELGLGAGMGLRVNFEPLVLRLDLAIPLTKPWLPEGDRWVGNQIEFGSSQWRKENLQWNLAFGYPF